MVSTQHLASQHSSISAYQCKRTYLHVRLWAYQHCMAVWHPGQLWWYHGGMAPPRRQDGTTMEAWYHDTWYAPWHHGKMMGNGTMAPWQHGTMAPWLLTCWFVEALYGQFFFVERLQEVILELGWGKKHSYSICFVMIFLISYYIGILECPTIALFDKDSN